MSRTGQGRGTQYPVCEGVTFPDQKEAPAGSQSAHAPSPSSKEQTGTRPWGRKYPYGRPMKGRG